MIRCLHEAVAVPALTAPYDTVHLRVFHEAHRTDDPLETQSGMLPADRSAGPRPVVVVLPGVNIGPEGYRWLAERWVAEGFVVVTLALVGEPMPGLAGITPGMDLDACRPDTYGSRPTALVVGPVVELLGRMALDGPLAGVLDPERIVLAGFSAGGTMALQNANPDWFPVVAAISYAGHTMASTMLGWPERTVLPVAGDTPVPVLMLAGELDGVVSASATRYVEGDGAGPGPGPAHDPVERTFSEALGARPGPAPTAHLAVLRGATHTSLLDPYDGTTGRGFLDPAPGRPPGAIRDAIGDLSSAFLGAHVLDRGGDSARLAELLADVDIVVRGLSR
ncbi:MAG: alpha/beta hydrolase family protein [Actinomycetes bacterium]